MATTVSITSTYAGEAASGYISAALLSASTIEGGGITVKPNVKYKEVIRVLSTDGLVADGTCDFSDTSTITTTERILAPENFQVNLEVCKSSFRSDWDALEMGYSAHDVVPKTFQDYLIGYVAAKVAQKTEQTIWHGVNATAGEHDGLVVKMTADATVVDVVGTTVTAANVVTELGKVVDAIPVSVLNDPDLKLYVAPNVHRAYVRSLGGFGANGLGAAGFDSKGNNQALGSLLFDGIPVFVANGLNNNYIVAARSSNLFFACGLLSDDNEVKVLDMAEIDGSQNLRLIMRFAHDVNYGIGSECVLYTPI